MRKFKKFLAAFIAGTMLLATPIVSCAAPLGQQNASQKAGQYLSIMAFSHDGLIEQLQYEGYSVEDATFAADNCGADWNAQALTKATKYLSIMAFSYDGLIEQLEYDKFTPEQAAFAADNCGADWNAQAAAKAAKYLSIMALSRSRLIEQLEYDGFTPEQAAYGVAAVGY